MACSMPGSCCSEPAVSSSEETSEERLRPMNALAVVPPDRWMEINLLETLREHYCEHLEVFAYPGGMGRLGSKSWSDQRDQLNTQLIHVAERLMCAGRLDVMFFIVYDDFLTVETAEK